MKKINAIRKGLVFKLSVVLFVSLFSLILLSSAAAQGSGVSDQGSAVELETGSYIGQDEGTAPAYVSLNAEFFGNSGSFISGAVMGNTIMVLIVILLAAVFIATFVYFKADKRKKLKKFVRFCIGTALIFVVFAAMPMNVSAAGEYSSSFAGGTGTESDPYQISDVDELQYMNLDLTAHYILVNDIDALETSEWNAGAGFLPVGNSPTNSFTGAFDGDGYTISDLFIDKTTQYTGLFGFAHGASIHDVTLEDVDISGGLETGALVGRHRTDSEMSNCSVTGSVTGTNEIGGLVGRNVAYSTISDCSATCEVSGNNMVGGLVGYNWNSATISNSNATCNVDGNWYVGGLVGYSSSGNLGRSTISNSSATSTVSGSSNIGGLVGRNTNSTISGSTADGNVKGTGWGAGGLVGASYIGTISNCHAAGNVVIPEDAGGLAGYVDNSNVITDCYATGDVSGNWYVGGLVSENVSSQISNSYATGDVSSTYYWVGGLVGMNIYDSKISNSYATGNVIGTEQVGGLVGRNHDATISDCSADGHINGTSWVGGLVGSNYLSTVLNCHATGNISGAEQVGGLTGRHDSGTMSDCYAVGNVTGTIWVGGLIGHTNICQVSNCYATGDVSGSDMVGGLVGNNWVNSTISQCYAIGSVSGIKWVGGLAGQSTRGCTISYSYATGSVSGNHETAGLVGNHSNDSTITDCYATGNVCGMYIVVDSTEVAPDYIGGLIGSNWNTSGYSGNTVSNSYSTGHIGFNYENSSLPPEYVGGLIGDWDSLGTVSNCYWDTETSGQTTSDGGTGKTTAEMKQQTTFAGWDFVNIWKMNEYRTYPLLWYQNSPPIANAGADQTVIVGEVVNFDGSDSSDPDGSIESYAWDFDDTYTDTGATPTHSFGSAGTYYVTLIVTDNDGDSDSDTVIITVITPEHATQDLITMIDEMGLPDGIETSLISKLENAIKSISNDRPSASGQLGAFINEVNAQREVTLTNAEADALIAFANWILENI